MKSTLASMVSPPAAPAHEWNWRADLAEIDVGIDHVESGDPWNWRRDLAAIEAEINRLAERLGL